MSGALPVITPEWPAPAGIGAAASTRTGGVSEGAYASLNLGDGSGDDPGRVSENRRRLRTALALPAEPGWLRQVHGATVVEAGPGRDVRGTEADASFTRAPGVVCAVLVADCLPVLFCDEAGSVAAAAHAGWRGLASGVLGATVRALPVDASRLLAWLGPAIGPGAFEVGPEVREAFLRRDPGAGDCFRRREGRGTLKYLADLYGLARRQLEAAGVARVSGGGRCTFSERDAFFSYRRDGRCGRMAALVWRRA